jgi:solute carrier family 25 (mitochondrial folate transporter), member 32
MLLIISMKYATCSVLSTVLSSIVVSPLDVLRTRNQAFNMYKKGVFFTVRDVLKKEGIKGCYRGLPGTLLSAPFFWSIYLPLYDHFKEKEWGIVQRSIIASYTGSMVCNPLFVFKNRLQVIHVQGGNFKNVIRDMKALSLKTFHLGLPVTLFGNLQFIIKMPIYEHLRSYPDYGYPNCQILFSSIIGKSIANTIFYPHEVIRTITRVDNTNRSLQEICRYVIRENGIKGFYRGFYFNTMRTIPFTCLNFFLYEFFKKNMYV